MTEPAAFDQIAAAYDADFTHSEVGKLQREQVYAYLERFLQGKNGLKILEVNCGTGEDARWMAEKGHEVHATDLSGEMIRVAGHKSDPDLNLSFQQSSILDALIPDAGSYDLVFSNFGGFNCLSPEELHFSGELLGRALKPGGHFIGVVMPRGCLWENFYFGLKMNPRQAFRRLRKGPLQVPLDESTNQLTWYYDPRHLRRAFASRLKLTARRPIGFFLPPSYLDTYFRKHPKRLAWLHRMERRVAQWSFLSRFSDHYLVDFTRADDTP